VPSAPAIAGRPLESVVRGKAADIPAISEISHRGYVAYGRRTSRDKYIERFNPQSDELYFDLLQDPRERMSRLDRDPERMRFLKDTVETAMIPNPFLTNLRFRGAGAIDMTLASPGWIEGLRSTGFGPQDRYEVEARRTTRIRLAPRGGLQREVSFTVRPIGAPVWLSGTIAGQPLRKEQIHIAREGVHPVEGPPYRLPEIESEKERVEDIFAPPANEAAGIHIWLTPTGETEPMKPFDRYTCEKMKALGYIAGDCP
jgi:hypothetical protein